MTEATQPAAPAKKPFEKRYKTVVPILRGDRDPVTELGADDEHQDVTVARWLGRESFENTAAGDRLALVKYSERVIPSDEVNPLLAEALKRPAGDFDWLEFVGLGRLDQAAFDYFAAEFVWHCEKWLAAERAHLDDNAEAGT